MYGNNFWFSAPVLCDQLNAPVWISLSDGIAKNMRADLLNSSSPVRLKPRMVYANFSSPMQVDVKFHVNVSACILIGLSLRSLRVSVMDN